MSDNLAEVVSVLESAADELESLAGEGKGVTFSSYGIERILTQRTGLRLKAEDLRAAAPASTRDLESELVEVARAIWNVRRIEEDRCDMELEDMGRSHTVWDEARAVLAVIDHN